MGRWPATLLGKYGFALASLVGYVTIALLAEHLLATGRIVDGGPWFHHLAGAVFGALVLGPYAVPRKLCPRRAGLSCRHQVAALWSRQPQAHTRIAMHRAHCDTAHRRASRGAAR